MFLMTSYNLAVKEKNPTFYNQTDIIRINTPWYSRQELINIFSSVSKPKFVDVNIKKRTKPRKSEHNPEELFALVGQYNIEWIGISNVESSTLYQKIKDVVKTSRICAKIETLEGCKNYKEIVKSYDGIMVDVEDLAFEIGWIEAIRWKKTIHQYCEEEKQVYFNLVGVMFEVNDPKIVYTYGAWDLLHPGHINMLLNAKACGNKLVVGVVGNDAIEKLKGKGRPVQTLKDRMTIVTSLKCVDMVIEQKDYNPVPNLEKINPNVLVKGDDWEHIPGEEWIREHGGILVTPKYSKDWSTSSTVKKILGEQ